MNDSPNLPQDGEARIWCFGACELDEFRRELRVNGQWRAIETKPMSLLLELLSRGGEVATKDELMAAVWPNLNVVEGSLPTAISKLRQVLGDQDRLVITAVHGIGYRIGVAITHHAGPPAPRLSLALRAGEPVPGRQQWVLDRLLNGTAERDVWLACHEKTGECRVFKFAATAERLEALRREAAISRLLHASLGERADFVRVSEWNFETRPYFIESPYGGQDLPGWTAAAGGLAALRLETRLAIVAQIARCVAAAHAVGVLHRDLKPSNVLIDQDENGQPRARLVDFGSSRLTDAAKSGALNITGLGLAADDSGGPASRTGTFMYMAPEVLDGGPATISADIFALGIILYQMVVGNLDRPLAAGWEGGVPDPLLVADITAAADGNPDHRLASASLLAERLDSLAERQRHLARQIAKAEADELIAARLQRLRARRPWLGLAFGAVALAAIGIGLADLRAERRGDEARRQAAIARSVNRFLTDDLLARGNPERAGRADETLMEAASRAEVGVDKRFADDPFTAGTVHLALAQAFERRTGYAAARTSYSLAIADFLKAQGPTSPDANITRLRLAAMEALSAEAGSKSRAQAALAAADAMRPALGPRTHEAQVWRNTAQGAIELDGGDATRALALFTEAADLADRMPETFDESRRLWLRHKQAIALFRLGRWDQANAMIDTLLPRQLALHGPRDADTLLLELTKAQVQMGRGASAQAVAALDRLYPAFVAVYGGDHRLTTGVLAARAQTLGQLERYDEAVRDGLVLHALAVARHGEGSWIAIATLSDVAESRCRAGHADAGLEASRHALALAQKGFGANSAQAMAMMGEVAFCLIVADRAAEATPLIDAIDPKALSDLGAGPDFPAQLDVMRADIALSAHDIPRARALLAHPAQVFNRPDADPYIKRWVAQLLASTKD